MHHTSAGASLREPEAHDATQIQREKFAVAACVLHVISLLQCSGFFLDDKQRVLSLNPIAVKSLGNGLVVARNRLLATDRDGDARLQQAIGLAVKGPVSLDAPAPWLDVHRPGRMPLLIRILRLEKRVRPALNGACLLLVAFDPENRRAPPAELLIRAFGLTSAEAEVANRIANGKSVAEIAAERRVKTDTVRTYTKIVLGKTGTRGQAELVALLMRLAVLTNGFGDS